MSPERLSLSWQVLRLQILAVLRPLYPAFRNSAVKLAMSAGDQLSSNTHKLSMS